MEMQKKLTAAPESIAFYEHDKLEPKKLFQSLSKFLYRFFKFVIKCGFLENGLTLNVNENLTETSN